MSINPITSSTQVQLPLASAGVRRYSAPAPIIVKVSNHRVTIRRSRRVWESDMAALDIFTLQPIFEYLIPRWFQQPDIADKVRSVIFGIVRGELTGTHIIQPKKRIKPKKTIAVVRSAIG